MTTLVELCYVAYWLRTFYPCMEEARVYRQRLMVTAAMIGFLAVAGHLASKELGAVLSGWAFDLPPLNGTASRERIWGWSKPREATNATRKEGTG